MRPLVSVLTPTYNGAPFLVETVESVLGQTYERVEHVLVDDGSTDGTHELLCELAARHPNRVRVVPSEGRLGPCRRRNDAFAAAAGDLIAWLDHDDLFHARKLELQVVALATTPSATFVFSDYEEFDDRAGETTFTSSLRGGDDLLARLFVEGCFIASSSVVFRRSTLAPRALRFRDEHFSFGDDYYLWLALLLDGPAVHIDEPLVRLRRHDRNESARLAETNYHALRVELLRDFLDDFPDAADRLGENVVGAGLAQHSVAAAGWELERGRRLHAARQAVRAASYDPTGAARFARGVATRRWRRLRS